MPSLYLISPPAIETELFASALDDVLATNIASAFQLRLKNTTKENIASAANALITICHRHGIPFILNDDPQLAKNVNADGVHVGSDDTSISEARAIMGANAMIGASCYDSIDLAIDACEAGANYVSFGAFFDTPTKEPKARPLPDIITKWITNSNIPCAAIGGITPDNADLVSDADFICVISAIWSQEDPVKAIEAFTNVTRPLETP